MAEEHHSPKETMPFDKDEANRFVGESARDTRPKSVSDYAKAACIDGRDSRQLDDEEYPLPSERFPGGGLGLLMNAYAGLALYAESRGAAFEFEPGRVAELIEEAFGEISFHTDDVSREKDLHACAGCAHLAGILADPTESFIPEEAASFIKGEYLPALAEKTPEPVTYHGQHAEAALFVIEAGDVSLPSVSKTSGRRAFVYNRSDHREAMRVIAKILLPLVTEKYLDATLETLTIPLIEAADKQTALTVNRVAADLPRFVVYRDENQHVLVREVTEEENVSAEREEVSDTAGEKAGTADN